MGESGGEAPLGDGRNHLHLATRSSPFNILYKIVFFLPFFAPTKESFSLRDVAAPIDTVLRLILAIILCKGV